MLSKVTESYPIMDEISSTTSPPTFKDLTSTVKTLIYQHVEEVSYNHHKHVNKNDLLWAIILGAVLILLMSFGLAANSAANSLSTIVGSKTLSLKNGLLLNIFFQLFAFIYVSLTGSKTELHFILRLTTYNKHRTRLLLGQVSMILGLAVWFLFALYKKMPVVLNGFHTIRWGKLLPICLSWIVSPLLSSIISLTIFAIIDYFILRKKDDTECTRKLLPVLYAICAAVNSFAIIQITIRDFGLFTVPVYLSFFASLIIGGIIAILIFFFYGPMFQSHIDSEEQKAQPLTRELPSTFRINRFWIRKTESFQIDCGWKNSNPKSHTKDRSSKMQIGPNFTCQSVFSHWKQESDSFQFEYQFGTLLFFTSSFLAFTQAVHNLRQSVVPLAILLMVYRDENINDYAPPSPILLIYVLPAICLGIYLCGGSFQKSDTNCWKQAFPFIPYQRVCCTVWDNANSHPLGVPVSVTYCLVGSVMAVDLIDQRENNVDWKSTKQVIMYWLLTLPLNVILVAFFSFLLHFAL
ncbi:Phosphate transporter domain containing protein [Aphelenchoides bicaudatus]|nr:Phosphate transporter domain containing protein [Aphelenchoides bicaudatus]